jgi:hypothetical protein
MTANYSCSSRTRRRSARSNVPLQWTLPGSYAVSSNVSLSYATEQAARRTRRTGTSVPNGFTRSDLTPGIPYTGYCVFPKCRSIISGTSPRSGKPRGSSRKWTAWRQTFVSMYRSWKSCLRKVVRMTSPIPFSSPESASGLTIATRTEGRCLSN